LAETGFVRDKLDIKFLLLFVLANLEVSAGFDDIMEMALIEDTISYLDCADAYYELKESGHLEESENGVVITAKGREALEAYGNRLPSSVRRQAQRSVLRTMARLRQDAAVTVETTQKDDKTLITSMKMSDGRDEIIRIDMLVVNRAQAVMLEKNFRKNAGVIYNAVLETLLKEYEEADPKPEKFRDEV
jgi:hypothetical protein